MTKNPEASLNDVLNSPGPEQLDYLTQQLRAESLLGADDVAVDGLMQSLLYQRNGQQVDAIGPYVPGVDAPHNIDIVSSYASDKPMARKVLSEASPAMLHVILDTPERLDTLTGNYRAKNIAMFVTALCGRISEVTESDIALHHNDGHTTGQIYEGTSRDLYHAFNQIDGRVPRQFIAGSREGGLEQSLQSADEAIDYDNDAVFVVSDFLDGYDKNKYAFPWEKQFSQLHDAVGDRLWAVRLTSPSQKRYPPLVSDAASFGVIQAMNRDFADLTNRKEITLKEVFRNLTYQGPTQESRVLAVDTFREHNDQHPVRALTDFVLGNTEK
ncbi:hypothetical protein BH23PAT2_BH23PAT2_06810 [soil metagenome]